jgi:hypothetical protein
MLMHRLNEVVNANVVQQRYQSLNYGSTGLWGNISPIETETELSSWTIPITNYSPCNQKKSKELLKTEKKQTKTIIRNKKQQYSKNNFARKNKNISYQPKNNSSHKTGYR